MPIVTAIEQQQHDPERINVFLDGKFGFGISRLLALSHGVQQGTEIDDETVEKLRDDDAVDRAFNAALNLLSFRPRSRRELESYFRRKGIEQDVGDGAIARLERTGLLDDREFARFWVENRQASRPRGSIALRSELRAKGVGTDDIEGALEESMGEEESLAYRAGSQKLRSYDRLDEREFVRRMIGFLQRRGFPYPVAAAVTRRLAEVRGRPVDEEDLPPMEESD